MSSYERKGSLYAPLYEKLNKGANVIVPVRSEYEKASIRGCMYAKFGTGNVRTQTTADGRLKIILNEEI